MSHIPLNLLEVQAMDSNPRVNAGKFIRDFSALAASLGSNLLDGGLLEAGAISTNAEYAADFPDSVNALGVVVRPQFPAGTPVPENTPTGQMAYKLAQKKDLDDRRREYMSEMAILKAVGLTKIGPVGRKSLMHKTHGHARVTCLQIMNYAKSFGNPTGAEIDAMVASLRYIPPGMDLLSFISDNVTTHELLEDKRQKMSEHEMMKAFVKAVAPHSAAAYYADDYFKAHPKLETQTYAALADHVLERAPQLISEHSGVPEPPAGAYHASHAEPRPFFAPAHTPAPNLDGWQFHSAANLANGYPSLDAVPGPQKGGAIATEINNMVKLALDRLTSTYENHLTEQMEAVNGIITSLASSLSSANAKAAPSNVKPYCFHHGWNTTHTGLGCSHMASTATFSQDMKAATGPCTIDGIVGSTKK